jgi:hypothetical protein
VQEEARTKALQQLRHAEALDQDAQDEMSAAQSIQKAREVSFAARKEVADKILRTAQLALAEKERQSDLQRAAVDSAARTLRTQLAEVLAGALEAERSNEVIESMLAEEEHTVAQANKVQRDREAELAREISLGLELERMQPFLQGQLERIGEQRKEGARVVEERLRNELAKQKALMQEVAVAEARQVARAMKQLQRGVQAAVEDPLGLLEATLAPPLDEAKRRRHSGDSAPETPLSGTVAAIGGAALLETTSSGELAALATIAGDARPVAADPHAGTAASSSSSTLLHPKRSSSSKSAVAEVTIVPSRFRALEHELLLRRQASERTRAAIVQQGDGSGKSPSTVSFETHLARAKEVKIRQLLAARARVHPARDRTFVHPSGTESARRGVSPATSRPSSAKRGPLAGRTMKKPPARPHSHYARRPASAKGSAADGSSRSAASDGDEAADAFFDDEDKGAAVDASLYTMSSELMDASMAPPHFHYRLVGGGGGGEGAGRADDDGDSGAVLELRPGDELVEEEFDVHERMQRRGSAGAASKRFVRRRSDKNDTTTAASTVASANDGVPLQPSSKRVTVTRFDPKFFGLPSTAATDTAAAVTENSTRRSTGGPLSMPHSPPTSPRAAQQQRKSGRHAPGALFEGDHFVIEAAAKRRFSGGGSPAMVASPTTLSPRHLKQDSTAASVTAEPDLELAVRRIRLLPALAQTDTSAHPDSSETAGLAWSTSNLPPPPPLKPYFVVAESSELTTRRSTLSHRRRMSASFAAAAAVAGGGSSGRRSSMRIGGGVGGGSSSSVGKRSSSGYLPSHDAAGRSLQAMQAASASDRAAFLVGNAGTMGMGTGTGTGSAAASTEENASANNVNVNSNHSSSTASTHVSERVRGDPHHIASFREQARQSRLQLRLIAWQERREARQERREARARQNAGGDPSSAAAKATAPDGIENVLCAELDDDASGDQSDTASSPEPVLSSTTSAEDEDQEGPDEEEKALDAEYANLLNSGSWKQGFSAETEMRRVNTQRGSGTLLLGGGVRASGGGGNNARGSRGSNGMAIVELAVDEDGVEFIAGVRSGAAAASSEKRSSVRDLLDIARQGAAAAAARRKEAAQKQQAQSEEAEAGSQSDASSASSFGNSSDSSASRKQSTSNLTATATRLKEEANGAADNTSSASAAADAAADAHSPNEEESFVEDKDVSSSEWRRSRRMSHGATLNKLRSLRASATQADATAADAAVRRSRTSSRRSALTGDEDSAESAAASHVDSRRVSNKTKAARASAGANTVNNAMASAGQQQIAAKRASAGSKVKASLQAPSVGTHTRKSSDGVGSTGSPDEGPRNDDDDDDDVEQEEEEADWNSDEGEGDEAAGDGANDESVELAPLVFSDEEDEQKSLSSSPRGAGTAATSSTTPQKGILRSASSSTAAPGRQSSKQLLLGHRSSSGAVAHGTPPSSRSRSRRTSGAPRSVQFASPNARAATLPPRPTRISDPTIASLDVSAWSTSPKSSPPRAFRRHLSGQQPQQQQQQQRTLVPEVPVRFAAARTATSPRTELRPSKGSLKQRQQQPSLSRVEAYALALRNQQQLLHERQQQRPGAHTAATRQSVASAMRASSPGSTTAAVVTVVSSRPTSSSSVRSRSGSPGRGSASDTPRAHSPLPPLSNVATESSAGAHETAPRPLQGVRNSKHSRRSGGGGKSGGGFVRHPAMEGMQSPSALILFDEKFFVDAHAQAVQEAARLAAAADAAAAAAAAHAQALQAAAVRDHVSASTTPFPPSSAAPSRPRSRVASRRTSRSVSRSALHDSVEELEEEAWKEEGEAVAGRSRSRLDWSPSRGDSPSRRAATAAASVPVLAVAGRSTQPLDDESFAAPATASSSPRVALPTHVSEDSYALVRRGSAGSTVPMPRARTVRSPASFALPLPSPRAHAAGARDLPAPPGPQTARIGMMALASAREAALAAAAAGSQTARAASSALAALQQQRPHTSWQPSRPSQQRPAAAVATTSGWFGAAGLGAASSASATAVPFPPVGARPRTSGSLVPTTASSSFGTFSSAHRSRRRSQMRASFDAALRVPEFIKVAAYKRREEL